MEKQMKMYYSLDNGEGEGGIMELSGCMQWIKTNMDANYSNATPNDDLPQYILTAVWMTDEEYEALQD